MKTTEKKLPIIPYIAKSGQLLLPQGLLPIVITTPAEIKAVETALKKKRLIGIIQPESQGTDGLYKTGCLGKITTFAENEDGSLYLIVKGICRFKVLDSKEHLLHVDYDDYQDENINFDSQNPKNRTKLLKILKGYLDRIDIDIDWDDVVNASDGSLSTSLAMMCPFEPNEKQAILESNSIQERLEIITAVIELDEMKKLSNSWRTH